MMKCETITWEFTKACNLRCLHCVDLVHKRVPGELSSEELTNLISQLEGVGVKCICFSGGEPFLAPHFLDCCADLRKRGIELRVITNGSLLTDEIIGRVALLGFEAVGVSLDGPAAIHDKVRGQIGLFAQATTVIRKLKEKGVHVSVSTCVNSLTLAGLEALVPLLADLQVDDWQLLCLVRQTEVACTSIRCDEAAWRELDTFILRTHGTANLPFQLRVMDCQGVLKNVAKLAAYHQRCEALKSFFSITSDGKVKGCLNHQDEYIIGDLRKKPLSLILEDMERLKPPGEWGRGYCSTIV